MLAAGWFALDHVLRPIYPPTQPTPNVPSLGTIALVAATAAGVWKGKRPARWFARGLAYIYGIGAWIAIARFHQLETSSDWWYSGAFGVTAALMAFILTQLGWAGDDN